jgi:aspartate carbamoyltransferase catalytic subunit
MKLKSKQNKTKVQKMKINTKYLHPNPIKPQLEIKTSNKVGKVEFGEDKS